MSVDRASPRLLTASQLARACRLRSRSAPCGATGRRTIRARVGDQHTIRWCARTARRLHVSGTCTAAGNVEELRGISPLGRPREIVFRAAASLCADGNGSTLRIAVACRIADQRANSFNGRLRFSRRSSDGVHAGKPHQGKRNQQSAAGRQAFGDGAPGFVSCAKITMFHKCPRVMLPSKGVASAFCGAETNSTSAREAALTGKGDVPRADSLSLRQNSLRLGQRGRRK